MACGRSNALAAGRGGHGSSGWHDALFPDRRQRREHTRGAQITNPGARPLAVPGQLAARAWRTPTTHSRALHLRRAPEGLLGKARESSSSSSSACPTHHVRPERRLHAPWIWSSRPRPRAHTESPAGSRVRIAPGPCRTNDGYQRLQHASLLDGHPRPRVRAKRVSESPNNVDAPHVPLPATTRGRRRKATSESRHRRSEGDESTPSLRPAARGDGEPEAAVILGETHQGRRRRYLPERGRRHTDLMKFTAWRALDIETTHFDTYKRLFCLR